MSIAEKLKKHIAQALAAVGAEGVSFTLEHPTELSHGDYATNAAMVCAKTLGKNPREIAEIIVAKLEENKIPEIETIQVAGPGFVNITLSKKFFHGEIPNMLVSGDGFGASSMYADKKILVEHSSPNLFKPFHVGHMMNNAIGESLVRLFRASGAETLGLSFPSDVGLGIAKAVYATSRIDHAMLYADDVSLESKMKFLGDCYVQGTKAYEDDPGAAEEIKKINADIYGGNSTPEYALYVHTKALNMEYFKTTVKRLGSNFDGVNF